MCEVNVRLLTLIDTFSLLFYNGKVLCIRLCLTIRSFLGHHQLHLLDALQSHRSQGGHVVVEGCQFDALRIWLVGSLLCRNGCDLSHLLILDLRVFTFLLLIAKTLPFKTCWKTLTIIWFGRFLVLLTGNRSGLLHVVAVGVLVLQFVDGQATLLFTRLVDRPDLVHHLLLENKTAATPPVCPDLLLGLVAAAVLLFELQYFVLHLWDAEVFMTIELQEFVLLRVEHA